MERSFGKKLCQGGEEKRGGYKLVKSFVFFLRPVRENLGCTTEEKKLPSILLFWANNAEKKVMVEHQSWKEFLQHSSSNPIKLFALLWIPRNLASGLKLDSIYSNLYLNSIYLNKHPTKLIKIKFSISWIFVTCWQCGILTYLHLFYMLTSLHLIIINQWAISVLWMQNHGNIYSEICYAGANQICAASLSDFSQVVAFPSHFTLLLKFGGKNVQKVTYRHCGQHSRPRWAQLIETFPVALFQDSDDFLWLSGGSRERKST